MALRSTLVRLAIILCIGVLAYGIYLAISPEATSVWFGVIGSILAAVVFECSLLAFSLSQLFSRRHLRYVFGRDVFGDGVSLVYTTFRFTDEASQKLPIHPGVGRPMPYHATDDPTGQACFTVDDPVPDADLRAVVYIERAIVSAGGSVRVERAKDITESLDRSFVAFGLCGSQKSRQIIDELRRFGVRITSDGPIDLRWESGEAISRHDNDFRTGYIVSIRPSQFPARVWCLCGGIGAEGTSGSAFYLSRNYHQICKAKDQNTRQRLGHFSFLLVTRSRPGLDESTELIAAFALPHRSGSRHC